MQERIEQINFFPEIDASVRDYYDRRAAELRPKVPIQNLIGEPAVRYTENGLPIYQSDNVSEIYRHKDESLLEVTPFRDQRIITNSMYISNQINGKGYKAGFLDNEIVVKRLMDSKKGKWPQKRNMRPYILLTPAKYHFTRKDQMVDQGFRPGEIVWIPCGSELKVKGDKKKERIQQIILSC